MQGLQRRRAAAHTQQRRRQPLCQQLRHEPHHAGALIAMAKQIIIAPLSIQGRHEVYRLIVPLQCQQCGRTSAVSASNPTPSSPTSWTRPTTSYLSPLITPLPPLYTRFCALITPLQFILQQRQQLARRQQRACAPLPILQELQHARQQHRRPRWSHRPARIRAKGANC